jgi:hypothetical protein
MLRFRPSCARSPSVCALLLAQIGSAIFPSGPPGRLIAFAPPPLTALLCPLCHRRLCRRLLVRSCRGLAPALLLPRLRLLQALPSRTVLLFLRVVFRPARRRLRFLQLARLLPPSCPLLLPLLMRFFPPFLLARRWMWLRRRTPKSSSSRTRLWTRSWSTSLRARLRMARPLRCYFSALLLRTLRRSLGSACVF